MPSRYVVAVLIARGVLGAVASGIMLVAPVLMSLSDKDIPDTYVRYTFVEGPPAQGLLGDSSSR